MLKPLAKLKPTWWGILYGFLRPGTEHTKSLNYMTQTKEQRTEKCYYHLTKLVRIVF